jgi:hypothetical protein
MAVSRYSGIEAQNMTTNILSFATATGVTSFVFAVGTPRDAVGASCTFGMLSAVLGLIAETPVYKEAFWSYSLGSFLTSMVVYAANRPVVQ